MSKKNYYETMKQGKRTLTQQDRENILSSFHHFYETDVKEYRKSLLFSFERAQIARGLFTRREGYPSKRVNPSWRAKDSPGSKVG